MTAYDTTYNRDLARSQRLYDYANIKNDTLQYNMGPTHQGGGMSGGMNCGMGRPFSDVVKGMGYSGGVRRGAELADMASPSGQFSVPSGRAAKEGSGMSGGRRPKLVKGSAEAKAYMASIRNKKKGNGAGVYGMPELLGRTSQVLEGRGGTDGFPSGFKDNNANAMSGGAVPLKQQLRGILDDRTLGNGKLSITHGAGMSGGDFWSDFGDGFMSVIKPVSQVVGAIAPFLGGGMSGGNEGVSSELALMSGSTPLAEAFLGGRKPQDVPRDEKVMLMKKALADYAMMKQFKKHLNARQGGGMSGGNAGLANSVLDRQIGSGMSGGALSYEGNMAMADAMGDIFSGMGMSGGRGVGCGMSGGKTHKLKLKPEMYGTSMVGNGSPDNEVMKYGCGKESESDSDEEEMKGGRRRPARLVKGSAEAKAYMASIRKKKGRGMSGGGIMEPAVSAEVGQPRYSYGQMADTAGKSNVGSGGGRRKGKGKLSITHGAGMSGGDFWSDLGGVAQNLLPLVPLLL